MPPRRALPAVFASKPHSKPSLVFFFKPPRRHPPPRATTHDNRTTPSSTVARAGGPYEATLGEGGSDVAIDLDGGASTCGAESCDFSWRLACPGAAARDFEGASVTIYAGPSDANAIDTTGATAAVRCNLTLTVAADGGGGATSRDGTYIIIK